MQTDTNRRFQPQPRRSKRPARLRLSAARGGLLLRPVPARALSRRAPRDIEVPQAVLLKWHREAEREPTLRDVFTRLVEYRRTCSPSLRLWSTPSPAPSACSKAFAPEQLNFFQMISVWGAACRAPTRVSRLASAPRVRLCGSLAECWTRAIGN